MSGNLALIASGFDLLEEHIAAAMGSREETKGLLRRLSDVSAPDSGVAKVLLVYARMATTACEWIDGDLCVDLVHEADATSIHAFTELGGGLRERLFAATTFRAPLTEFARSISRAPHMISPLALRSTTARRIRLSATELVRRTTVPPPLIPISPESLYARVASPATTPDGADGGFDPPLPIVGGRPAKQAPPELPVSPPGPADSPRPGDGTTRPGTPSEPPLNELDNGWDE